MKTYIYDIKCLACGLHFKVFSWNEDWWATAKKANGPHCPECGKASHTFPLRVMQTDDEIYMHVHG